MSHQLRIVLLVANAVFFAWLAYRIFTVEQAPDDAQFWLGFGILISLVLNFVYLLLHQAPPANWRIFRLESLV
jgi:hypothetical protein